MYKKFYQSCKKYLDEIKFTKHIYDEDTNEKIATRTEECVIKDIFNRLVNIVKD